MVAGVHNPKHDLSTAIPAALTLVAMVLAIIVGAELRTAVETSSAGGSAAYPARVVQSCCGRSVARRLVTGVVAAGEHGRGIEGTVVMLSR